MDLQHLESSGRRETGGGSVGSVEDWGEAEGVRSSIRGRWRGDERVKK